ncbi:MAG TPA: HAD family hydrolase [Gemmatimonadales bacterium]
MDDSVRGAVLLDFGGTIDGDGERWSVRFHRAYRVAGGSLDFAAFDPCFRESDRRLERRPGITQLGFRATVAAQAEELMPLLPDGGKVQRDRMADGFCHESLAAVERNTPVIVDLSDRWKLGVVSNYTGNLGPCLEELGLAEWFEVALDSTVVGVSKPDARIFRLALDALKVTPGRAWMVGDNFEADIRPAAALGLSTVWLAPPDATAPGDPGKAPTERIAALPDLARVLEAACTA